MPDEYLQLILFGDERSADARRCMKDMNASE
jgi:hypothetical protein